MAISKALRFQIFRRDDHTCQYCGGRPPDVSLTVDHVVPVALGGSDTPSNLVTACRDCNSGKAATPPDAPTVAAVDDRNRVFMAHVEQLGREAQQERESLDWFMDAWMERCGGSHWAMPPLGWEESVLTWLHLGLLPGDVVAAVDIAWNNRDVTQRSKFRYTAGVCRRKIQQRHDQAAARLLDQDDTPDPGGSP